MKLSLGDRIFGWVMSTIAFTFSIFFLARDWTTTHWTSKLGIVFAGIFAARFAWFIVEDNAKARANVCPTCGKRL